MAKNKSAGAAASPRTFKTDSRVEAVHVVADGIDRPVLLAKILECKLSMPEPPTTVVVFALDSTTLFFKLLIEALPSFSMKNIPHKLNVPDIQECLRIKKLLFLPADFIRDHITNSEPLTDVDQVIFYEPIPPDIMADILNRLQPSAHQINNTDDPVVMSFVQPIILPDSDVLLHEDAINANSDASKSSTCVMNTALSKRIVSRQLVDEIYAAVKSSFDICRCGHDSYTAFVYHIIALNQSIPSYVKMYGRSDILTMAAAFGLKVPPRIEELSSLS